MKNRTASNNCRNGLRLIALTGLMTLMGAAPGVAQQNNRQKPQINFTAGLSSCYDDNILKYSDKYIERFLNHEDSGRFHIDTYDDLVLSPEADLSISYRLIGKLSTTFNAGYKLTAYAVNRNKNRSFFNLGLRQNLTRKASIKIAWDYIPDYYIRHFRDDDWVSVFGYTPETFRPFSFAKESFSGELTNTFFRNTRVRLIFDRANYFYNAHFTEYDCHNNALELNIRQQLVKNLKIEAAYGFTVSTAKGSDEPGETRQTSDDSDGSYEEDAMLLRLLWDLPRVQQLRHSLDGKVEFGKRYFTSEKSPELDPLHAGRVDNNLAFNITYALSINKNLGLAFFYSWFSREAGSLAEENDQFVSEEKDYGQSQIGVSVSYSLKK